MEKTQGKSPNLVGKVFGTLTVIGLGKDRDASGCILWSCICTCGANIFYRTSLLTSRTRIGCRNCKWGEESRDVRMSRSLLRIYKNGSKRRNIIFDLTDEQFYALIIKPCHYCGKFRCTRNIHTKEQSYKLNGVDRVDNALGYTLENSVPCCTFCNQAKNSRELGEFLHWIKEIYEFQYYKGD